MFSNLHEVIRRLSEAAHRVVVTVLADEGYAAIAWNIGAALTHQITEGL